MKVYEYIMIIKLTQVAIVIIRNQILKASVKMHEFSNEQFSSINVITQPTTHSKVLKAKTG